MTPLRYKAWHNEKKEMFYPQNGDEFMDILEFYETEGQTEYPSLRIKKESWAIIRYTKDDLEGKKLVSSNSGILVQSTGLKDKNGKEIFEGDVVIQDGYIWFDGDNPNYRGTVEWVCSQWQVITHCVNPDKRGISDGMNEILNDEGWEDGEKSAWEIIGNIYENPELLTPTPNE